VGETMAKKLARHFRNIDNLIKEKEVESLTQVEDVGETVAQSIIDFFKEKKHIELIERLKKFGIQFESEFKAAAQTNKLEGLTFVVSGVFTKFSRDDLKTAIEQNGGKVVGSVSGKTSFIVAGENMGPEKLKKAEKLGVKIIDENEFEKMIK
jgi:DNA ligase (NAD+)